MDVSAAVTLCEALVAEPPIAPTPRSLARSAELSGQAEGVIPGCSQTASKAPTQFVRGVAPVFLSRGRGARVWDVDGNAYWDWTMALCALVLGYADEDVNAAVRRQLDEGTIYTLSHPLEIQVASRLATLVPCAEMVRFAKNGSDVTAGAVRLARAITGRDLVACCGYHGAQDWYIGSTSRAAGVPKAVAALSYAFAYNDLDGLRRIFTDHQGEVAAVVMEPVGVVPPEPGFLEGVRDLCDRYGTLLVFDEIITGFRFSTGGAQKYFGVTPDLACFGKAMANGYPIAALVGRGGLMKRLEDVFFSYTFGGETVSLAAAVATMDKIEQAAVIPHLWCQGEALKAGVNTLARLMKLERYVQCVGYGPRTVLTFVDASGARSLLYKSLFQQECLRRGLLFTGVHNVALSHDDRAVEEALRIYRAALEVLAFAIDRGSATDLLEGPPVEPVFREL